MSWPVPFLGPFANARRQVPALKHNIVSADEAPRDSEPAAARWTARALAGCRGRLRHRTAAQQRPVGDVRHHAGGPDRSLRQSSKRHPPRRFARCRGGAVLQCSCSCPADFSVAHVDPHRALPDKPRDKGQRSLRAGRRDSHPAGDAQGARLFDRRRGQRLPTGRALQPRPGLRRLRRRFAPQGRGLPGPATATEQLVLRGEAGRSDHRGYSALARGASRRALLRLAALLRPAPSPGTLHRPTTSSTPTISTWRRSPMPTRFSARS